MVKRLKVILVRVNVLSDGKRYISNLIELLKLLRSVNRSPKSVTDHASTTRWQKKFVIYSD